MINYLLSKLKAFLRWESAKGTARNSNIYCKDIDIMTEVCSNDHLTSVVEAQPPIFLHSKEGIAKLRTLFPIKKWTPKTTEADLAFSAGEQKVIDYIENNITQQASTPL